MSTDSTTTTDDPIDRAIVECERYIELQNTAARRIQFFSIYFALVVLVFLLFLIIVPAFQFRSSQLNVQTDWSVSSYLVFAILTVFTIVFSVLMGVYRFHLNEAAKIEHYKMGFLRMRIAAETGRKGYQTEVRNALTKDAFTPPDPQRFGRGVKIESPLPGHPTTDMATAVINKLLESVDITPKQKDKEKDANDA